jgi:hypothetical protein
MDGEGSGIEQAVFATFDHLGIFIDTDEVAPLHQAESGAERVHPKRVWFDGVLRLKKSS